MLRNVIGTGFVIGCLAMSTPGVAAQAGQGSSSEPTRLEQRAEAARTAQEHAVVAREYRQQGERFVAQAREHETSARKAEKNRSPLSHKWPGSLVDPATRERQRAVEARRAAAESFALADHHVRSSVEVLADASERPGGSNRTN